MLGKLEEESEVEEGGGEEAISCERTGVLSESSGWCEEVVDVGEEGTVEDADWSVELRSDILLLLRL